jgi:hypothetical protein
MEVKKINQIGWAAQNGNSGYEGAAARKGTSAERAGVA